MGRDKKVMRRGELCRKSRLQSVKEKAKRWGKKNTFIAVMSSGKKWDTAATHTNSRCSSAHLERGKINRTLQKDESLCVVSASKQGRDR